MSCTTVSSNNCRDATTHRLRMYGGRWSKRESRLLEVFQYAVSELAEFTVQEMRSLSGAFAKVAQTKCGMDISESSPRVSARRLLDRLACTGSIGHPESKLGHLH
jgi:hypothetical protein